MTIIPYQQPLISFCALSPLPCLYLFYVSASISVMTESRTSLIASCWHAVVRTRGRRWKVCRLWLLSKFHVLSQCCFLRSLNIYNVSKCSKTLESCRWKRFEIPCAENAMGMNHRCAHKTWLYISLLQCSIPHGSIKILRFSSRLEYQASVFKKIWICFPVLKQRLHHYHSLSGFPPYLITEEVNYQRNPPPQQLVELIKTIQSYPIQSNYTLCLHEHLGTYCIYCTCMAETILTPERPSSFFMFSTSVGKIQWCTWLFRRLFNMFCVLLQQIKLASSLVFRCRIRG